MTESLMISHHARRRMKKRVGIPYRAQLRHLVRVVRDGEFEITHRGACFNYGEFRYCFKCGILATVVPHHNLFR